MQACFRGCRFFILYFPLHKNIDSKTNFNRSTIRLLLQIRPACVLLAVLAAADDARQAITGGRLDIYVRILVEKMFSPIFLFSCNCLLRSLTRCDLAYKNPLNYRSFKIILNTVPPYVITRDLCIITIHNNIFFWLVRKIRRYFFFRRI